MIVIFVLLILLFCFYPGLDGRMYYELLFGFAWILLIISKELWKKIHWSVGIFAIQFFISGLMSLYFSTYSLRQYPIPVDPLIFVKGNSEILYSMVTALLFCTLLLLRDSKFFSILLKCFFFAAIMDSFVLIFNHFIMGQKVPWAMLNNSTADATFIACMLPMTFDKWVEEEMYAIGIMLFAIFLCRSNTAMAAVFVGYASWLFTKKSFKTWLIIIAPFTVAMVIASYFTLGSHFLGNSGRFDVWKLIWDSFVQYGNYLFGFGTGNYTVWGDAFQRVPHINDPGRYAIWYWLHNLPLQVLFENGLVGLVMVFTVYYYMLKKTYKKSIVFPMACVYGLTSLTEMPERIFMTQVLGICFISIAFNDEPLNQESCKSPLSSNI